MRESNRLCGSRAARPAAFGSCLGLLGVPPLLPRLLCYSARRSQTSPRPAASGSCLGLSGVPPLLPRFLLYSARRSQTSPRAARPAASGSCLGLSGVPPIKIQPVRSGQINLPLTFWLYFCVHNCLISFLRAELFILNFYLKYSTPDSNTFRSCSPQILMATDWPWRSM